MERIIRQRLLFKIVPGFECKNMKPCTSFVTQLFPHPAVSIQATENVNKKDWQGNKATTTVDSGAFTLFVPKHRPQLSWQPLLCAFHYH